MPINEPNANSNPMKNFKTALGILALASVELITGCHSEKGAPPKDLYAELPADAEQITLLATNDIHGGLEASFEKKEGPMGGMAYWAGVVRAIEAGSRDKKRADVFVLDAGDQFQGTLVSNINEGKLMVDAMMAVGYDAVIPGNHDYDFGPDGWLKDTIEEGEPTENSKQVFRNLTKRAEKSFPFLSANTYLVPSLKDKKTKLALQKGDIKNNFCQVKDGIEIDWSKAKRPDFLGDYKILTSPRLKARIAVIGLDNPKTATQTMTENVLDLCFRDPYDTYVELRQKLAKKADIFVIVIHDGNTDKTKEASNLAEKLLNNGNPLVDVVVAGHTHYFNSEKAGGVIPVIQSRYGGRYFGRVDLFWSPSQNLLRDRTKQYAALRLYHDRCDKFATDFCKVENGEVLYDNHKVVSDKAVADLIAKEKDSLNNIDEAIVAHSHDEMQRARIDESPLANIVADGMLNLARVNHPETAVALINASGIRADIDVGPVTFAEFFMMLPFNNRELVVGPMKTTALIDLIKYSATTCGAFGTLMPAGLRVTLERKCPEKNGDLDPDAKLLQVVQLLADGTSKILYDVATKVEPKPGDELTVATLDFLAKGGEGFGQLALPEIADIGIAREELFKYWKKNPPEWGKKNLDGRWTTKVRP